MSNCTKQNILFFQLTISISIQSERSKRMYVHMYEQYESLKHKKKSNMNQFCVQFYQTIELRKTII